MTSPDSERCPPTDDGRCKGRPVRQDCQAHHAVAAVTRGRAQPPQRSGSCILDGAVRSSAAGTRVGSGDTHSNSLQDKRAQEARAGHENHHRAGRFHRAGGRARAATGRAQGGVQATGRGVVGEGVHKAKGPAPAPRPLSTTVQWTRRDSNPQRAGSTRRLQRAILTK